MLGGGLIPGRPYLVSGSSGSGKTLLGIRFLMEGIANGEDGLLVAVDEPPGEILENVRSFGWNVDPIHTLDANPGTKAFRRLADVQEMRALSDVRTMKDVGEGHRVDADDVSIQSIHLKLRQQMAGRNYRRVVVDSVTSIRRYALKASLDPQADRTEVQSLLRFLTEMEVTTLMTATPSSPEVLNPEEILTRGEVLLTRKWIGDRSVRQIKIVRMRGTAHDPERRPFVITPQGILVG